MVKDPFRRTTLVHKISKIWVCQFTALWAPAVLTKVDSAEWDRLKEEDSNQKDLISKIVMPSKIKKNSISHQLKQLQELNWLTPIIIGKQYRKHFKKNPKINIWEF